MGRRGHRGERREPRRNQDRAATELYAAAARIARRLDASEAAGVFTYKTTEQGASTTLVAAVAPEFERISGHYLDDCREAYTVPNDADLSAHGHGVKEWALRPRQVAVPFVAAIRTGPPGTVGKRCA